LDEALRRAERYLKAGADGIYVEAPKSEKELRRIGSAFHGVPQMTNMFEGDKETPWLTPGELAALGFSMILYPTTLLFRVIRCLQHGLENLRNGQPTPKGEAVALSEYEQIMGLPEWADIEGRFGGKDQQGSPYGSPD